MIRGLMRWHKISVAKKSQDFFDRQVSQRFCSNSQCQSQCQSLAQLRGIHILSHRRRAKTILQDKVRVEQASVESQVEKPLGQGVADSSQRFDL